MDGCCEFKFADAPAQGRLVELKSDFLVFSIYITALN